MKWFIFAAFAAALTWYFGNETLQNMGLAALQNGKWKVVETGWHILFKMWPGLLILGAGAGVTIVFVYYFLFSKEEEMKDEYDKKLKEMFEKSIADMKQTETKTTQLYQENEQLKKNFYDKEQEYLSKINHQHSIIQRLHKK